MKNNLILLGLFFSILTINAAIVLGSGTEIWNVVNQTGDSTGTDNNINLGGTAIGLINKTFVDGAYNLISFNITCSTQVTSQVRASFCTRFENNEYTFDCINSTRVNITKNGEVDFDCPEDTTLISDNISFSINSSLNKNYIYSRKTTSTDDFYIRWSSADSSTVHGSQIEEFGRFYQQNPDGTATTTVHFPEVYGIIGYTDTTSPTSASIKYNNSNPQKNQTTQFNTTWTDAVGISNVTFSWNCSTSGFLNITNISKYTTNLEYVFNETLDYTSDILTCEWKTYSIDLAGNIGESNSTTIFINKILPNGTPLIDNKPIGSADDLNVTITFYDEDGDSWQSNHTKWYKDDVELTDLENLTSVSSTNTTENQEWVVSVRVYDGFNWSSWVNDTVVINDTTPPVINKLYASSTSVYTTGSVNFYANVTDLSNQINTDACKMLLRKSDYNGGNGVGNPFNETTNTAEGTLRYFTLGMSAFGTGTIIWNETYCEDSSGNSIMNTTFVNITISTEPSSQPPATGGGGSSSPDDTNCKLDLFRPKPGSLVTLFAKPDQFSGWSSMVIRNPGDSTGTYYFKITENQFLNANCEFNKTSVTIKPNLDFTNYIRCIGDETPQEGKIQIQGCRQTGNYKLYVSESVWKAIIQSIFTGQSGILFGDKIISPVIVVIILSLFLFVVPVIIYVMARYVFK